MNSTQAKILLEFFTKSGGLALKSQWVTGSGNFIKPRTLPCYVRELTLRDARASDDQKTRVFAEQHPRAQKILQLDPEIRLLLEIATQNGTAK